MNKKVLTYILLFTLINTQCNKDNNGIINVSSITETDVLGNSTGHIDNTDWTKDNNWTSSESKLFESPTADQLANTQTSTISVAAYPNPVGPALMFYFNSSGITLAQIVITDKFLTIKERHYYLGHTGSNFLQINPDQTKYANNTNYRVYYSFYSLADGQYYKGHARRK